MTQFQAGLFDSLEFKMVKPRELNSKTIVKHI